jgi:acetylornithine deacetylase
VAARLTTTDWLRRLVAHRTVVGSSNIALIDDVKGYAEACGATATVIPGTRPGAVNLYVSVGPRDTRGIVLSGHTDVVEAPPEAWTSDPFDVASRDGRLVGRGTCDMKGFVASLLAALPDLAAMDLPRPVGIALSADEEMGVRGVGPMLDVLAAAEHLPLFCVVGEPTRMRVAVAHKGKVAMRIQLRGKAAHSSAPHSGVSAVHHGATLVGEVCRYGTRLAAAAHDDRFAVPHASVNVGRIEGGTSVNVIADNCEFDVEYRLPPRQSPAAVVSAVRSLAGAAETAMRSDAPQASVDIEILADYPGLDIAGEVPALVARIAETDCAMCADFGTEAGLFHERLGVPVVICGPGDVAQAHTIDEFIDESELERCDRFIRRLAYSLSEL